MSGKKSREQNRRYARTAYAKNPEKFREKSRKNRAARSAGERADDAAYYAKYAAENQDKIRAARDRYRMKNRERIAASNAAWFASNPERKREYVRNRKSALKAPSAELLAMAEWERRWRARGFVYCYWCLSEMNPKDCHIDHVKSRPDCAKDGVRWHSTSNVCIACAPCNLRKNRRSIERWNALIQQPVLL